MSIADELEKLDQLRARGVISQDEFSEQKKRILEGPTTATAAPGFAAQQPQSTIHAVFTNPTTGECKTVKVGFAWDVALLATFLGIPLFLRGLNIWGGVCLAYWAVNFLVSGVDPGTTFVFGLIGVGVQIWLATKANELTAKRLLETGWKWAQPESEATKFAVRIWQLGPIQTTTASATQP